MAHTSDLAGSRGRHRLSRGRAPDRRRRLRRGASRLLAITATTAAAVTMLGTLPASAATGSQYLAQATDPHGNVWLPGTTDGTTTGPMDPGTDSTSPSFGHLWTTDVPSGFCRIIPASTDGSTPASLDRTTPGGCITAGGKPGQPELDPRRNADGTYYVYTPDWAVKSNGVYRLTYDPGKQVMTKAELLAPNRYPFDNKPFDVQLGPLDHKLYVSNDKDGNIARISNVNGVTSTQAVETSIAKTTDGLRARAITFACWSSLNSVRTGPGCSPTDPAPDLVIGQRNLITVVLNAETCQTAPGGCVTRQTNVKVLTPMGLRTDPKTPDVIYVSDSPGTTSQIIRYTISTNTQDSYANYGILNDGTTSQFSFAFSVGFGPDHAMYVGDDPSAGATAFNGRYFRVAPNAPADALGKPGSPASPPPPPALQTGSLLAAGMTQPTDGVWMGTHLWIPDAVNGLCRLDASTAPSGFAENPSTCMIGANAAGMTKPEQSAFDATGNLLYVSDASSKSVGVVRFSFDPATETLGNPQVLASGLVGTGLGLDGQRADAVALDPLSGNLYVGFRARNLTAATQIARVSNPAGDPATQTVDFIAKTTRSVPVFGLGIVVNPASAGAPATSDLYIGDNKGVDLLTNVNECKPGECFPLLQLNVRGPRGFATDGKDHLYLAGPPAPGSASSSTPVQQYTISTGQLFSYSTVGTNPDGSQQPYGFVFGLALDPSGNLYVEDDANAVAPPNGTGHVWKVGTAGAPGVPTPPSQPSITSKPGNPTNNTAPSFAFSSVTPGATYQCSLTAAGSPAAPATCTSPFTAPTPLTDGSYTFAVQAVSPGGTSAAASYSFAVDTVAPTFGNVTASATGSTVTGNFTSSEAVSAQCALTTGTPVATDFAPCSSPQTYSGVANGTYTFTVQGTDLAGNFGGPAASQPVTVSAPPAGPAAVVTAPVQSFQLQGLASTTGVPVTLKWTGDQNAVKYELQQSTNGSAFFDVPGFTAASPGSATSATVSLTPSPTNKSTVTTYRFQVLGQNASGNYGLAAAGPSFSVPAIDNTGGFSFNGSWSGVNQPGAFGGSVHESSTANAFAQNANPLIGSTVALVSSVGPDRGIAQLTLDGTVVGTVDLYSPTFQPGVVVWSKDGLNGVGHTLKVTVTTPGNPLSTGNKVDVDAYLALK